MTAGGPGIQVLQPEFTSASLHNIAYATWHRRANGASPFDPESRPDLGASLRHGAHRAQLLSVLLHGLEWPAGSDHALRQPFPWVRTSRNLKISGDRIALVSGPINPPGRRPSEICLSPRPLTSFVGL